MTGSSQKRRYLSDNQSQLSVPFFVFVFYVFNLTALRPVRMQRFRSLIPCLCLRCHSATCSPPRPTRQRKARARPWDDTSFCRWQMAAHADAAVLARHRCLQLGIRLGVSCPLGVVISSLLRALRLINTRPRGLSLCRPLLPLTENWAEDQRPRPGRDSGFPVLCAGSMQELDVKRLSLSVKWDLPCRVLCS